MGHVNQASMSERDQHQHRTAQKFERAKRIFHSPAPRSSTRYRRLHASADYTFARLPSPDTTVIIRAEEGRTSKIINLNERKCYLDRILADRSLIYLLAGISHRSSNHLKVKLYLTHFSNFFSLSCSFMSFQKRFLSLLIFSVKVVLLDGIFELINMKLNYISTFIFMSNNKFWKA